MTKGDGSLRQEDIDALLNGIGSSGPSENEKKDAAGAEKSAGKGYAPDESFAGFEDDNLSFEEGVNNTSSETDTPELSPGELEKLIESCRFPLKLMFGDREMSAREIGTGNYTPPALDKFRDKKGSLMLGSTAIASVTVGDDSKEGLYADVVDVVADYKRGNLRIKETFFDYPFVISVELGRKHISLKQAGSLGHGTVISLDKYTGEPADVILEGYDVVIARGEVVLIDENFGIRITELTDFDIPGILSGRIRAAREVAGEAEVPLKLVLGRRRIETGNLLKICKGTILELDKKAQQHLELAVGKSPGLDAEVCLIDDHFAARIVAYDKKMIPEPPAIQKRREGAPGNRLQRKTSEYESLELQELRDKVSSLVHNDKSRSVSLVDMIIDENPVEAALIFIALGSDLSSILLRELGSRSQGTLLNTITSVESISRDTGRIALAAFISRYEAMKDSLSGGAAYTRELLEKSCGSGRPDEAAASLSVSMQYRPFGFLRGVPSSLITDLIKAEHPQVVTVILSFLEPRHASEILSGLPHNLQVDITERTAEMGRVSFHVIKDIESVLMRKLSGMAAGNYGGVDTAAKMLNSCSKETEKSIIRGIEMNNPDLAFSIRRNLFVFDDIEHLNDMALQKLIREVDTQDLVKALKEAKAELKDKIYRNMSQRAASVLREEIELMGPVRVADADESRRRIVDIMHALEESGDIVINRTPDEKFV